MSKSSRPSVAFQGEPGAFSHAAALKLLGERIKLHPSKTFGDVFKALESGAADCAVIPIENTLHGSVHENYDHLLDCSVAIRGETSIRIAHQLIVMPGTRLKDIHTILSHPVALNQCKLFFDRHKNFAAVAHYDTAGSVKSLKESGLAGTAAIASETAAKTYGGVILKRNIEDMRENFTRFFLLTKQPLIVKNSTDFQKTSVVFSTANAPSSLFRALSCFALRDLNLTKIESRPIRGRAWEYMFYVDFAGSVDDRKVQNALANLRECTQFFKLLGSYRPTP